MEPLVTKDNNETFKIINYNNGRWTPEESLRFEEGVLLYGKKWDKVLLELIALSTDPGSCEN